MDKASLATVLQEATTLTNNFSFCAVHNAEVMGFVAGVIITNYYHAGTISYISTLVVDELCRGKHIGIQLLDTVVQYAKDNNCKAVELDANFHRHSAYGFYECYGFCKRAYTFTLTL